MQQISTASKLSVSQPGRPDKARFEQRRPGETVNQWATRLLLDDQMRRKLY